MTINTKPCSLKIFDFCEAQIYDNNKIKTSVTCFVVASCCVLVLIALFAIMQISGFLKISITGTTIPLVSGVVTLNISLSITILLLSCFYIAKGFTVSPVVDLTEDLSDEGSDSS